jgi:formamidopyrimidine-DNA glycosylase
MPELPEVETIRSGLEKLIISKKVINLTFDWPKSYPNSLNDTKSFLYGAEIISVRRRAKVLLIDLSTQYSLVIHLKMTGQLVYKDETVRFGAGHPNDSLLNNLPDKSTRVIISFDDDSKLYFNDQRKFGWVKLMPTIEIKNLDFFKKVGPEPLSSEFNWLILKQRLNKRQNTTIKAALLDQTVLAGIGNIYADESLWGAKIHPSTLVKNLNDKEYKILYQEIVKVLKLSIELGGSTDKNYINAEGKKGSYLAFSKVFRKEGQHCPRCGTIIIKTRVAGRGTHLCPYCQKL